jgi:spore coat polysaccharide biosynthesis protein SpsF
LVSTDAAIITIRNSSKRLPNKAIKNITDKFRSIDILINRIKQTNLRIILATSTDPTDDIFEQIVHEHNIEIFRGSLLNKIKRWHDCFQDKKLENALLVDGDDLAYDYDIGIRALKQLKSNNLDLVLNPKEIVCGLFTYVISQNGISKLFKTVKSNDTDTDIPSMFMEIADLNKEYVSLLEFEKNKDIRLTLDYEDDLQFFRKLYQNIGILVTGNDIVSFLEKNEDIININFDRQKDYLENQAEFNKKIGNE